MRRIRTCSLCRKRYVTASGSKMCPNCRTYQKDQMNSVDTRDCVNNSIETSTTISIEKSEPKKSSSLYTSPGDILVKTKHDHDLTTCNNSYHEDEDESNEKNKNRESIHNQKFFHNNKSSSWTPEKCNLSECRSTSTIKSGIIASTITNLTSHDCNNNFDKNRSPDHENRKIILNETVTNFQIQNKEIQSERDNLLNNNIEISTKNIKNSESPASSNNNIDKCRDTHDSNIGNESTMVRASKKTKYHSVQTTPSKNLPSSSSIGQTSKIIIESNIYNITDNYHIDTKYCDLDDMKNRALIDTTKYVDESNCEDVTTKKVPMCSEIYSKTHEVNIAEIHVDLTDVDNKLIENMARDNCSFKHKEEETNNSHNNDIKKSASSYSSNNANICFICGCSLSTDIKKRVNHLKRCSKKNDISIRDVKHCDDDAYFISSANKNICNNNHGENDKWHGRSQHDLSLANAVTTINEQQSHTSQQTKLGDFFSKTTKSVNDVLMAGAKRVAKVTKILSNHDIKRVQQNPYKKVGGNKRKWNAQKKRTSYSGCPSYKRIMGTDFICDGFRYACRNLSTKYFLTHFHSDHYDGLSKTWDVGVIYCSVSTANLIHKKLGIRKEYIHPLPLHCPTIIEGRAGKPVSVTLIDANHCPGAVMFLFQVGNINILHVGDFRWDSTKMLCNLPPPERSRIDYLYLDTTYCDEKYYEMPTQQEAIKATIKAMEKHVLMQPERTTLFLFGSYTIGKEKVYLAAANRFNMKVYVDSTRYRTLSALECSHEADVTNGFMDRFTRSKFESPLWVVPNGHVNFKHLGQYLEEANSRRKVFDSQPLYTHVVGFRPTGWSFSPSRSSKSCLLSQKTNGIFTVYGVPYSEHSSFKELVDCLYLLKPKKIIPTVSVSKSEEQVELLLNAVARKNAWKT